MLMPANMDKRATTVDNAVDLEILIPGKQAFYK